MRDPARLPPLDLLASFEAAARHRSITRAGAERFVTQSAMSRQIRALEDDLGRPLFRRGHRSLALTEDGERLYAACSAWLAQLRETVVAIRAPQRRERLALTTTPGFAALWLIPRLPAFTKAHPGVDVRIDASHELRDLRRDDFDLAVRYVAVDAGGHGGRGDGVPLFGESLQPLCSPALRRGGGERPPLRTPADLRHHVLLEVAGTPGAPASGMPLEWASWLQAAGVPELEPAATLTFSGYNEAVAAALAGQGVLLGRRPIVDALLKARKLVAPFREATVSARGYRLVVAPGAGERPAVRALAQWLQDEAGAG